MVASASDVTVRRGPDRHNVAVSTKFYTRFIADLGAEGPSEYAGILELGRQERLPSDAQVVAGLIAKDLDVDAAEIRVLQWARVH
jgi:hypothetical protein